MMLTETMFDKCARELETNGYALMSLPALLTETKRDENVVAGAFNSARRALDDTRTNATPLIDPTTDSGSWTGFHAATDVHGRYNRHREGYVFSNGEMFDAGSDDFRDDMKKLYQLMHDDVADGVLRAIERRLELPQSYFQQEFGPTRTSSQWHIKRYVVKGNDNKSSEQDGTEILLPVHTDPSLISVVIIDQVGKNEGGMGLEVFRQRHCLQTSILKGGSWKEITHHGHEVAVIFIGSVLSYLTKGQVYSAARHRVVNYKSSDCDILQDNEEDRVSKERMVATLFIRPKGNSKMNTLPSRHVMVNDDMVGANEKKKTAPTFLSWNARVAKNYVKRNVSVRKFDD